ncbi:MAG: DUF3798 domain-containing protein, partial [Firmicutes bacterium]|nr:DUF3798 domain-containing protein [Bacillota bacterium]
LPESPSEPLEQGKKGQMVALHEGDWLRLEDLALAKDDLILWENEIPNNLNAEELANEMNRILATPEVGAVLLHPVNEINAIDALAAAPVRESPQFWAGYGPGWETQITARSLDLLLSFDMRAQAELMVAKAVELGAENLVFYLNYHHLYVGGERQEALAVVTAECARLGIYLDVVPISFADWEAVLEEDFLLSMDVFGKNTAFSCIDPAFLPLLNQLCVEYGAICPGGVYPFNSIPDAESLSALSALGKDGRILNYHMNHMDMQDQAIYEYAKLWLAGEVPAAELDLARLEQIMEEICGGDCHLELAYAPEGEKASRVSFHMEPYTVEWE